ncbi:hypothetical protein Leryth_024102 [Lithospermum erythrorhizon]|nr:hypothetical protein Leryth_024102 [Lithospermum erythrorhizon]
MDTSPKVVVCGGGIIGVCAAYFLSEKGASITLIEQSSIACGSSGKAGGFLALDWSEGGPLSALSRTSFNLHRSLADELDGIRSYGYRSLTTLSLTVDEAETKLPKYRGNPKLPSWVDGPAVEDYGAKVVIGRVEKVEVVEGRATGVVLEGGHVIEADAVVLALGPWTSKLRHLGVFRVSG